MSETSDVTSRRNTGGLGLRLAQCGQEQACQDRDYRNDDEQFDELNATRKLGATSSEGMVVEEFMGHFALEFVAATVVCWKLAFRCMVTHWSELRFGQA